MGSIWNANLTNAEIERYAYLYGKKYIASYAAEVEDQDDLETRHEDELEAARAESFTEGKAEGLGVDADKMINALRVEIEKLKAEHKRCRDTLQAVNAWLLSDGCKTVKDRKAYQQRLRAAINAIPHY